MQLFTAAHSNHEKCSLLAVSSPHNTDLSIKSKRYRITKGHPVKLIMIRGPVNRANTSKAQSPAHLKKKKSEQCPHPPPPKDGGFYMQHLSGVYWPGRTQLFHCFSTAADAVGNTSLLSSSLLQFPTLSPAPAVEFQCLFGDNDFLQLASGFIFKMLMTYFHSISESLVQHLQLNAACICYGALKSGNTSLQFWPGCTLFLFSLDRS